MSYQAAARRRASSGTASTDRRVTLPDDLETPDNEQQSDDNPVIRDLRKQAETAKTEKERADLLERKLALSEAGLTGLTDEQRDAITAVHKDEWNAEALKATAGRLGFGQQLGEEKPAEPQITAEERASMQRVNAASGGQPPPPAPELDAAIQNAETREDLLAVLRDADMLEIQ